MGTDIYSGLSKVLSWLERGDAGDPVHLRRVAQELTALADGITPPPRCTAKSVRVLPPSAPDAQLAGLTQSLYNARRKRSTFLPSALFGEPAWDILLDLFVNTIRDRVVTVTDACIASDAPPTTGLRWVSILVEAGLAERIPMEHDRRVIQLRLTAEGYSAVRNCIADAEIKIVELNGMAIPPGMPQRK